MALKALLTQASLESQDKEQTGAIMHFDGPLSSQYRALISPPLPLYKSSLRKAHFIIPISGHAERNEEASLTREELPDLPTFPTAASPLFPLPPPDVIFKIYEKNSFKKKRHLELIRSLICEPTADSQYIFRMPFQSHKNVTYHGHFPRLIYFSLLSDPLHAHAQVIAFANRTLTALDLDAEPNIMSTFSPNLFARAYFGISRLCDGHLCRTKPQELPKKIRRIPPVPLIRQNFEKADGKIPASSPDMKIPTDYLDYIDEAELRNIGKHFRDPIEIQREEELDMVSESINKSLQTLPHLQDIVCRSREIISLPSLPALSGNAPMPAAPSHGLILDSRSQLNMGLMPINKTAYINVPVKREFNESEEQKRQAKLARNRAAALKSRQKKKKEIDEKLRQIQDLENQSNRNNQIIIQLWKDHAALMCKLLVHEKCACTSVHIFLKMFYEYKAKI
jgi:hypothetical protein